jgi:N-acetylmuramoyl-L-alanine amidase
MSHYKWIIDAGHGGMKDGKYTTAPSKMFTFDDGFTFLEGVNNRAIANKLIALLEEKKVDFALVYDEQLDTPLGVRVNRANTMHAKDPRCIYVSIHSDAMPDGAHGKASGLAVFTSPGETKSDVIAEIFAKRYMLDLPQFKFRKEFGTGQLDHEEKFYVLVKTACPAILSEFLFYDNRTEAEYLASDAGRQAIAATLCESILTVEDLKPI